LAVNIGANTRPLQQGLQSALASAKSFASGVMQTFTGMQLSNLFTGAVQQTKQMAIAVVKLAADAEVARARFSVLLGNVADGAAMFKQLEKFALRTSFSIESASEAATMLLAKGVQQADVIDTMQLLGDLAMGDAERLGLLAKAYTDVQAKGKLMAQEQNQFAENGINLFELLQQTTGKNAGQLMAMREAGQITFSMLQTALKAATSQGGKFFGALAQGNATFSGQFNSLIEGVQTLGRMLGEMVLPRLKEIVSEANKLLQAFLEMPNRAQFLGDVLKASIDVAFAYIEQEWDSLLKRMILGAGNALADLLNATNPINVAAGMIGEGAGIMANAGQGQSLPAVAEAQERLRKLLDQLRQGAAGVAGAVDPNKVKPMGGPPAKAAEAITMSIADMISNMQANATPIIDSLNTWMGGTLLRAQMALQPLLNGKPTGRSMDPRSEFAGAVQFGTAEASAAIAQAIAQNKEPAVEATEQQTETLMQPLNVMANALKNGFVQKIVGNLLD
jgi:tape measure domain-containing protein